MTSHAASSDGSPERASTSPRSEVARAWADAVVGTSYVAWGHQELIEYLRALLDRLIEVLSAVDYHGAAVSQVGADLVSAHFTGPETLSRSMAVLGGRLPELLSGCTDPERDHRIMHALGSLAAGYATALRERALDEQDDIHRAMLVANRDARQRLAVSEARFHTMFSEAAIGIGIGDLAGTITDANPALLRMFGYTSEEFTSRRVNEMVHPDDAPSIWQSYDDLVAGRRDHFQVEKRFFTRDGGIIWTNLTVSLMRDPAGRPSYQVAMLEDITERRKLQSDLEHLAYHDALTGLPNRTLLYHRLDTVFTHAVTDARIGLCFVDLDGFKAVNDTRGHHVGDQLLVAVADRLRRCCQSTAHTVARIGGDEFVVLVDTTTAPDTVVELARAILATLVDPVQVTGHTLPVTASIGVVEQPVADTSPADLMSAADITLYWAKRHGKNQYAVFDRHRVEHEITRYTLAADLPAAVDHHEFVVAYQPLVSLTDGALDGVEALVRWQHPTYGLLNPDQFVGLAEETGAIIPLGRHVLAVACAQAHHWLDELGRGAPFVSVNLAPRQLQDPGLVDDVTDILDATALPPGRLQLELTEQAVMSDEQGPLRALNALHDIGVRLAIDDFGTGYSNLSYLRRLPVHSLKLDGSFVRGMRHADVPDPTAEKIVGALVSLAHALNLTVVAEGIETPAQLTRVRTLGCDAGQGWYLGAPGPPDHIHGWLLSTRAQRSQ